MRSLGNFTNDYCKFIAISNNFIFVFQKTQQYTVKYTCAICMALNFINLD